VAIKDVSLLEVAPDLRDLLWRERFGLLETPVRAPEEGSQPVADILFKYDICLKDVLTLPKPMAHFIVPHLADKHLAFFVQSDNYYRARIRDCRSCLLKAQCCPKAPLRRIPRSIYEEARDLARALAKTEVFERS
jgi:hypothetical protein